MSNTGKATMKPLLIAMSIGMLALFSGCGGDDDEAANEDQTQTIDQACSVASSGATVSDDDGDEDCDYQITYTATAGTTYSSSDTAGLQAAAYTDALEIQECKYAQAVNDLNCKLNGVSDSDETDCDSAASSFLVSLIKATTSDDTADSSDSSDSSTTSTNSSSSSSSGTSDYDKAVSALENSSASAACSQKFIRAFRDWLTIIKADGTQLAGSEEGCIILKAHLAKIAKKYQSSFASLAGTSLASLVTGKLSCSTVESIYRLIFNQLSSGNYASNNSTSSSSTGSTSSSSSDTSSSVTSSDTTDSSTNSSDYFRGIKSAITAFKKATGLGSSSSSSATSNSNSGTSTYTSSLAKYWNKGLSSLYEALTGETSSTESTSDSTTASTTGTTSTSSRSALDFATSLGEAVSSATLSNEDSNRGVRASTSRLPYGYKRLQESGVTLVY